MITMSDKDYNNSGTASISSGDGAPVDVLELRDGESFELSFLRVDYGSGHDETDPTSFKVDLYDESVGTSSSDLDRHIDSFHAIPGDYIVIDDADYELFERGIVVEGDGNNDSEVQFTVGGVSTTG